MPDDAVTLTDAEWEPYHHAAAIQPETREKWARDMLARSGPRDTDYRATTSGDALVLVWYDGDGRARVYDCRIVRALTTPTRTGARR